MSVAAQRKIAGRTPITVVEIDLDLCANVYGSTPCTASGAVGSECYNTRKTCQDKPNYLKASKTYRFCENQTALPIGIDALPCVVSVSTAPSRITPMKGLGYRASVSVKLQDFPIHDRGVDPYASGRPSQAQGTFFGRLLARNPYYQGRIIRIKSGFVTDPIDWANFETRTYMIEQFKRDSKGNVTIVAKDMLKHTDVDRAQCPVATTGELATVCLIGDTSLSLKTGLGSQYAASGFVRIDDEVIAYASITGDTLSGLVRGTWGTVADEHDADVSVQLCHSYQSVNVVDIITDLLTDFTSIDVEKYLDADELDAEKLGNLSSHDFTALISEPEGVKTLIEELCTISMSNLWWDERLQKIRLKAIAPPDAVHELNDTISVLDGGLQIKDEPKDRVSQVWIYYNPKDYTKVGDAADFSNLHIQADLNAEADIEYGEKRVKRVFTRWAIGAGSVIQTASRWLLWMRDNPQVARIKLDAKDAALWMGDAVHLTVDAIQDMDGSPKPSTFRIIEAKEIEAGTTFEYLMMSNPFFGRYAKVAPLAVEGLTYSTASEDQKNYYFIAPDANGFADGGEACKIA